MPNEVAMEKVGATPARSCHRSAPMPISASARGIARGISHMLYRVRHRLSEREALAGPPASSVIFVINHRSNMDYVLVTYVAGDVVGAELCGGRMGAGLGAAQSDPLDGRLFHPPRFRRALYRKVLARYVHMATAAGVTQAVFPEGGLSRDGKLRPPKLGLLSYMVSGFDPLGPRDVVFIPVARQLRPRAGGPHADPVANVSRARSRCSASTRRPWRAISSATSGWHARRVASLRLYLRQFRRAGVAAGSCRRSEDRFSRCWRRSRAHAEIERLGNELMEAVGRVVPALPVSLVATAMLEAGTSRFHCSKSRAGLKPDRRARTVPAAIFTSRAPTATTPSRWACGC